MGGERSRYSSLRSSLFRFLLAVESESRGEVARRDGARAKNLERGRGVGRKGVPVPSRDSRLFSKIPRSLVCFQKSHRTSKCFRPYFELVLAGELQLSGFDCLLLDSVKNVSFNRRFLRVGNKTDRSKTFHSWFS